MAGSIGPLRLSSVARMPISLMTSCRRQEAGGRRQEAGDSLMMKLSEAAKRMSRLDVLAPDGVEWALAVANRNFIIHQYDQINRELTWVTLSVDLPAWQKSLARMVDRARSALDADAR